MSTSPQEPGVPNEDVPDDAPETDPLGQPVPNTETDPLGQPKPEHADE